MGYQDSAILTLFEQSSAIARKIRRQRPYPSQVLDGFEAVAALEDKRCLLSASLNHYGVPLK